MSAFGNLAGFDASQVEPQRDFSPVPAGTYTAMITKSEMKPTKDGQGQYLYLEISIAEGEHEGRLVFARLNLENRNDKAVEIARRELSSICRAVGVLTPKDSQELHDRPMQIKVGIEPARDGYEASNKIKAYLAVGATGPTAPAPTAAAAATAPAGKVPPWKR